MNATHVLRLSLAPVVILAGIYVCFSQQRSDPLADTATGAVVSMPNEGEIYLGTVRLTLEQLGERIKSLLERKPPDEQVVYIYLLCPF